MDSGGTQAAGPRQGFRITAELAAWLGTPPDLANPPDDQMTAKVLAALRAPGTDVHEVVQVHRRHLMERMQQWTRIKRDKADHDLGLALKIDAELFRLASVIQWLDAADRHLTYAAAMPPPPPVPPTLAQLDGRAVVPAGRVNRQGASRAAEDRIRISDHDREHATARLCEHFAEGRLTREELDERITAALNARTAGDLRRVMAALPEPAPAWPPWRGPHRQ